MDKVYAVFQRDSDPEYGRDSLKELFSNYDDAFEFIKTELINEVNSSINYQKNYIQNNNYMDGTYSVGPSDVEYFIKELKINH